MPATPIASPSTFFHRGKTVVVFITGQAGSAPIRAEINAGTDISDVVTSIEGWEIESGEIETPVLGSEFVGKIGGSLNVSDSSVTCLASQDGDDIRDLLPRDTEGFMLFLWGGDVAGYKGHSYPIRVRSVGIPVSTEDEPATVVVSASISSEPTENFTIPA